MSVESSWERIWHWMQELSPVTASQVAPPAPASVLAAVAGSFPSAWPDDLREWYSLQDGETRLEPWHRTLPGWTILALEDIEAERSRYLSWDGERDSETSEEAGEPAFRFLDSFVPIASNGSAETLFVDLRSGEMHGCVTGFFFGDADAFGPVWTSIETMLEDVANSLEYGTTTNDYTPSVKDGVLDWI